MVFSRTILEVLHWTQFPIIGIHPHSYMNVCNLSCCIGPSAMSSPEQLPLPQTQHFKQCDALRNVIHESQQLWLLWNCLFSTWTWGSFQKAIWCLQAASPPPNRFHLHFSSARLACNDNRTAPKPTTAHSMHCTGLIVMQIPSTCTCKITHYRCLQISNHKQSQLQRDS